MPVPLKRPGPDSREPFSSGAAAVPGAIRPATANRAQALLQVITGLQLRTEPIRSRQGRVLTERHITGRLQRPAAVVHHTAARAAPAAVAALTVARVAPVEAVALTVARAAHQAAVPVDR